MADILSTPFPPPVPDDASGLVVFEKDFEKEVEEADDIIDVDELAELDWGTTR